MSVTGRECYLDLSVLLVYHMGCLLTHWGRVMHIFVGKLTSIGSDNGLSPGRRQAIIWTNAGILLIGHSGTNFSECLIVIHTFSFNKMHKFANGVCEMASILSQLQCIKEYLCQFDIEVEICYNLLIISITMTIMLQLKSILQNGWTYKSKSVENKIK